MTKLHFCPSAPLNTSVGHAVEKKKVTCPFITTDAKTVIYFDSILHRLFWAWEYSQKNVSCKTVSNVCTVETAADSGLSCEGALCSVKGGGQSRCVRYITFSLCSSSWSCVKYEKYPQVVSHVWAGSKIWVEGIVGNGQQTEEFAELKIHSL